MHAMKARGFFLLFLFLPPLAGCKLYAGPTRATLSSKIALIPLPYGEKAELRPSRPTIFLSVGENLYCRPAPFDARAVRQALTKKTRDDDEDKPGLSRDVFEEVFGVGGAEEGGDAAGQQQPAADSSPVKANVSGSWLKLGMFIANQNTGVENDFWLVVDNISFQAVARHRGETFAHAGSVSDGCGAPFLYIVAPGHNVLYKPYDKTEPLHNLTIYLSGFPIIDRTAELSADLQAQQRTAGSSAGAGGAGAAGAGSGSQSRASAREGLITLGRQNVIVIPDYTVELTLRGYFMNRNGSPVASYLGRTRFRTQSSFR